jgi:hypothetical protein
LDSIAVDADFVYWGGRGGGTFRVPRTGGDPQPLSALPSFGPIAADDTRLYFGGAGADLYGVPKTGGSPQQLVHLSSSSSSATLTGLVVAAGRLYWSVSDGADGATGLWSARTDGSDVRRLSHTFAESLRADDTHVYFSGAALHRTCLLPN